MNHGQFYKSAELVAALHRDSGGKFPGCRAVHAVGRIYAGIFIPTAQARGLSRAAHFREPTPVTARFSGDSGDPNQKPSNVAGMAVRFYLPDDTITDLVTITLPAFPARNPDEFIEFLGARAPDPATGKPDLARLGAFLAAHPHIGRVVQQILAQPALASFAQVNYRALHAFYFLNESGQGRWARYHFLPEAGVAAQPPEELAKKPQDYLFEELEERLQRGPVAFGLDLELAGEGDSLDDPSAFWPEDRPHVAAGRLELIGRITEDQIGDAVMMHDPTRVTDGIEVASEDQIVAARRAPICSRSPSGWAIGSPSRWPLRTPRWGSGPWPTNCRLCSQGPAKPWRSRKLHTCHYPLEWRSHQGMAAWAVDDMCL